MHFFCFFSYFSHCCYIFIWWIESYVYVFSKFPLKTKAILQRKVLIQIEILLFFAFCDMFLVWAIERMQFDFERKISMEIFCVKWWIDWPKFCMSNFTFYVWVSVSNSLLCLLNLVILVLFGQCRQLDNLFVLKLSLNYGLKW